MRAQAVAHLPLIGLAATGLVCGSHHHNHITPILTTLHWLPVHKRVMFRTVLLVWKCLNGTAPGYLACCLCFRSSLSQVSLNGPNTSSQSPNHDWPAEPCCCRIISVEQSSGCSTGTGADIAHFQVTTQGLSVPRLMCQRTEGTSTTSWHCCGVFL